MEKARKLRRYNRKDYTQVVEFPVEIVGRDGVVQRYSFEDSICLYQRRIASASLRYEDREIVDAEVRHCQRRIEQLRRSYFTRYGWSAVRVVDTNSQVFSGEMAGEVAAFLRRCFNADKTRLEDYQISPIERCEHYSLYFIKPNAPKTASGAEASGPLLLYLYRFSNVGKNCPERAAFFSCLKMLQGVQGVGSVVEELLAYHHTADCGLLLTGRADSAHPQPAMLATPSLTSPSSWLEEVAPDENDPLRTAVSLLRHGKRREALRQFTKAYEKTPFRRAAYIGAIVVADQLAAHEEADLAAEMASMYFPDDGVVAYHSGLVKLRRGQLAQARDKLALVKEKQGAVAPVLLLLGLIDLLEGQVQSGRALIRQVVEGCESSDSEPDVGIERAAKKVLAQLTARNLLRYAIGLSLMIIGGGVMASGWFLAVIVFVVGLFLFLGAQGAWQRQLGRLIKAPSTSGLSLANPKCFKGFMGPLGALQ